MDNGQRLTIRPDDETHRVSQIREEGKWGSRRPALFSSLAHILELLQRAGSVTAVSDQTALHSMVARIIVHVNVGNAVLQRAVVVQSL